MSSSAASDHPHRHHLRPNRIALPPRAAVPYAPSTPTPTPSKHRLLPRSSTSSSSISFPLILLFSLRSLYSLLPFLRSSPNSFSLFPFSFLVSLFSFLLTFLFYFKSQPSSVISAITKSNNKTLFAKSILLAFTFLLRFQALRYCGTSAMILAELAGNLFGRFLVLSKGGGGASKIGSLRSVRVGSIALFSGLVLLCVSWDRVECFPLSSVNIRRREVGSLDILFPGGDCVRVWPMLLPFLSGFLGCCEKVLSVRDVGLKRVRLVTLFYTTVLLFVPAVVSMVVFEAEGDSISVSGFGWPLVNTVVFGVLLSENFAEERIGYGSKDFEREYLVTFVCVVVLELFYYPELSLWGLLICGILKWIAVRELSPLSYNYPKLGFDESEAFGASVMKPLRHILSERKSRKIALFLLINTAYMVVEFVAGFMSNSLGLISDACHMLFDCAALSIGLYASYISHLPANGQWNYGHGRFEVLSGYVNAVFLVLVGALITLESFERIFDPQEISTSSLLSVSIGGLFVNIIGLIFFHEEHHAAHGGSGTCAHSHSDTHHHDHHSHDHHHDKEHACSNHHDHLRCNNSNHEDDARGEPEIKQHSFDVHHHHHVEHHNHDGHHHHHTHVDESDHQNDGKNKHQPHHHHHHIHVDESYHHHKHGENKHQHQHHHHHMDHNMQGIFLHVLADTMGSVGVVVSTLLIKYKGWLVADPACSIFISALIVSSVIPLLKNSAEILLQRAPRTHEHDIKEGIGSVMKIKGVLGIQNLHVWSFTNTDVVGTIHLLVSAETDKAAVREQASHILRNAGIKDLTMQIECVHLDKGNQ